MTYDSRASDLLTHFNKAFLGFSRFYTKNYRMT